MIRGSSGVIESRTCFLPMITPQSQALLKLHLHYTNQVLPFAGGLLDQPALYAEAMEILSARSAEIDADLLERMRKS